MTTRILAVLMAGMLGVGLLGGCATVPREDLGGLVRSDTPEYFAHPLRIVALWTNAGGQILQYGIVEPAYLLLHAPAPEFWGLSLEERRYWETRQEEWAKYLAGERPAYK
jgi:hypothetical protein